MNGKCQDRFGGHSSTEIAASLNPIPQPKFMVREFGIASALLSASNHLKEVTRCGDEMPTLLCPPFVFNMLEENETTPMSVAFKS